MHAFMADEGSRDWTITYEVHDVIANDDHAIAPGTYAAG